MGRIHPRRFVAPCREHLTPFAGTERPYPCTRLFTKDSPARSASTTDGLHSAGAGTTGERPHSAGSSIRRHPRTQWRGTQRGECCAVAASFCGRSHHADESIGRLSG